jgi:NAD(P)-dependent dehydrogenase (short-subunit alcohol dehydrogenase family)
MLESFDIKGKQFVISGATSGLGLDMARTFLSQGASVIGLGRNTAKLQELSDAFGGVFQGIKIDLSNLLEIETYLSASLKGQQIDGFVHAAGIISRRPVKMIKPEIFEEILKINVISGGLIAKVLHKDKLLNKDASLVYISSVAADYAAIGNTMYMASKGAVNSMVRGLALEFAQSGVRVNAIQPGLIHTHLTEGISSEEIEGVLSDYPLGRLGELKDVTAAAQFLLSKASSWMTGQFLRIDGGLTLK